MTSFTRSGIVEKLRAIGVSLLITLVTLLLIEGFLQLTSPRMLRDSATSVINSDTPMARSFSTIPERVKEVI